MLTSPELVAELTEVMGRKKFIRYLTLPVHEYVEFHLDLTSLVDIKPVFTQSPDPKDNFLFDIVIQHHADYLVTGDRRLLETDVVQRVEVISLSSLNRAFL